MLLGADSSEGGGGAAAAAGGGGPSSETQSAATSADAAWAADVRQTLEVLFEAMPSLSAAQAVARAGFSQRVAGAVATALEQADEGAADGAGGVGLSARALSRFLLSYLDRDAWEAMRPALQQVALAPTRHPFSKAALFGNRPPGSPWRRAALAFLGSRHVQLSNSALMLASLAGLGEVGGMWRAAQRARAPKTGAAAGSDGGGGGGGGSGGTEHVLTPLSLEARRAISEAAERAMEAAVATAELSEESLVDVPGVHALIRATVSNGKVAVDVTEPLRRYLRPARSGGLVLWLGELRRSAEVQKPPEDMDDVFTLELDPHGSGLGALAPHVPPRRTTDWKDKADRGSGREGYTFGDITKSLFKGNLGATEPRTLRIHYERATPARAEHAAPASASSSFPTPAAASSPRPSTAPSSATTPPPCVGHNAVHAASSVTAPPPSGGDYVALHAAVDALLCTIPR